MDRAQAEVDPSYKQVIPYVVLSQVLDDEFYVYMYTRTTSGGESRLHNLRSIGIGGHVNPVDGETNESVSRAMYREVMEEVSIRGDWHSKIIGCIYDDSNEVGRVHFGIVRLTILGPRNFVKIKEPKLADGGFMRSKFINGFYNLENWSKLTLDYINSVDWRELTKSSFDVEVRECL